MGAMKQRRNKNRGYQQWRVWQDAVELYRLTCQAVQSWPFERKKVAGQAIASADSVHRNIVEGYCRRSLREYRQFLNFALGSLGESVSGYMAYHSVQHISDEEFEALDKLAFRLENGLIKLVETLERKQARGDWVDSFSEGGETNEG
jgi:four helix bundle protein